MFKYQAKELLFSHTSFFSYHTIFFKEREDYHRARSSSTGNGGGGEGYSRGGGNSRRKYSYDDDMSTRRGDWKCMEVNVYMSYHFLLPSFDAYLSEDGYNMLGVAFDLLLRRTMAANFARRKDI